MNLIINALRQPRKYLDVLRYRISNPKTPPIKYRLFKVIGHFAFNPFIILTRSRTGSTLLVSYLNSHPNIWAQGEIFKTLDGEKSENIIASVYSKQPYYIKATGFKIFYDHPKDDKEADIWDILEKMDNLSIIHLKRKNILRAMTSKKIADKTKLWTTTRKTLINSEEKKVVLTAEELKAGFMKTKTWEEQGDERFGKHNKISIYYEDLVDNPDRELKNITRLLNIPNFVPKTIMKKQNPEKLSDLIKNYEELKSYYIETEWSCFFE